VVEEVIPPESGDVDVVAAVVVEVSHGGAHAVEDLLQAGLASRLAKARQAVGAVALVVVERQRGLLVSGPGISGPVRAGYEKETRAAVTVVVEDRDAAAHRLVHPLRPPGAVDVGEADPDGLGLLLEAHRGNGSGSGRDRGGRFGGFRGASAGGGEEKSEKGGGLPAPLHRLPAQRSRSFASLRMTGAMFV